MKDEIKFFWKYVGKTFIRDVFGIFKSLRGIIRPKIWFLVFSGLVVWFVYRQSLLWSLVSVLGLFITWAWDVYDAGDWKYEYRKTHINEIKKSIGKELKGRR